MCGRYTLYSKMDSLEKRFSFTFNDDYRYLPRFNILPTQDVVVVTNNGQRHGQLMRWGLVPDWAASINSRYSFINAVSETVNEKISFRDAYKYRRCLVLADGFFEWKRNAKSKQPYYIFESNRKPFAFAGLWNRWVSSYGDSVLSCAILTCPANGLVKDIHSRMPVILDHEAEALWLDPLTSDTKKLGNLLIPFPMEYMSSHPVSLRVNFGSNQDSQLIEPR